MIFYKYDKCFRPISTSTTLILKGIDENSQNPLIIKRAQTRKFYDYLKNEAQHLENINNENIPKLLGTNEEKTEIYLEYIPGITLYDFYEYNEINQNRDYFFIYTLAKISNILQDIHLQNLVHNDIKCTNIILSESGPKLIDFDLSYNQNIETKELKRKQYSPSYTAPEKINNSLELSEATDIFSFGIIAYKLLMRTMPFYIPETQAQEYDTHIKKGPKIPFVFKQDTGVEDIVNSCLAYYPNKRPAAKKIYEYLSDLFEIKL